MRSDAELRGQRRADDARTEGVGRRAALDHREILERLDIEGLARGRRELLAQLVVLGAELAVLGLDPDQRDVA